MLLAHKGRLSMAGLLEEIVKKHFKLLKERR